jgi:hypothetical protein
MNRSLLILTLLVITLSWSLAQSPFRVILSYGNNYEKNEKGFSQLNNGTLLQAKDEIIIMPNGSVILMDIEGRLLELALDGRYLIANLDLSDLSSPSALIYQEWEAFYKPKRQIIQPIFIEKTDLDDFRLDFPASTAVYSRFIQIEWPDLSDQYQITIRDEYDMIIERFEKESPGFQLDLLSQNLAFRDFIAIDVLAINRLRSTGIHVLDKLSPPEQETLDQLLRIFPEENDLIIGLTKAAILNNKGLYADASSLLLNLKKTNKGKLEGFYQYYLKLNGF